MVTTSAVSRDHAGHDNTPDTSADRHLVHRLVDELPDGELAEAARRLDGLLAKHDRRERALIARWIRPHPLKRDAADVVVADSGVPVYAIIGYLPVAGGDLDRVATDYEVPREAIEAALAYYRRHRELIDARMYTGRQSVV